MLYNQHMRYVTATLITISLLFIFACNNNSTHSKEEVSDLVKESQQTTVTPNKSPKLEQQKADITEEVMSQKEEDSKTISDSGKSLGSDQKQVNDIKEKNTSQNFKPKTPDIDQDIELHLPFTTQHEPPGMMPMGETINHPPPIGHPGIDFQWPTKEAEIIVALSGVVGDLVTETSPFDGETIYIIYIITDDFGVTYEVVDLPEFHPDLQIGDELTYGTTLGYPQVVEDGNWRMMHWGFGIARPTRGIPNPEGVVSNYFFDWICPIEYLKESELDRLEKIWEAAHYNNKDKFPDLCNGYYKLP